MNRISIDDAKAQIGLPHWRAVDGLLLHLGDTQVGDPRLAPSIVTRSELSLFGLSAPRFAVRIFPSRGGFINCRRLAVLQSMLSDPDRQIWTSRYESQTLLPEQRNPVLGECATDNPDLAELLSAQKCVADCLLPVPTRLKARNPTFVSVNVQKLLLAYGEHHAAGELPLLLPFTQTVSLGGGLCAQAASFMATTILCQYAKSAYGVAEITALAHARACRELSLGGLTPRAMADYFTRVNLRLSEQCVSRLPMCVAASSSPTRIFSAIRCYIASGMPVILPVTIAQLSTRRNGENSVYEKNRLKLRNADAHGDENHVVVLVGFSHAGDEPLFVFHDSATLPYLQIRASEMQTLGAIRGARGSCKDGGVIMAVTPKAARMPLLDQRMYRPVATQANHENIDGYRVGLDRLTRIYHFYVLPPVPACPSHAGDRFLLVRSDFSQRGVAAKVPPERGTLFECAVLRAVELLEEAHSWTDPHWIWIELYDNSIWVWDAHASPPNDLPETPEAFLAFMNTRYLLASVFISRDFSSADIFLAARE